MPPHHELSRNLFSFLAPCDLQNLGLHHIKYHKEAINPSLRVLILYERDWIIFLGLVLWLGFNSFEVQWQLIAALLSPRLLLTLHQGILDL